MCVEFNDCVREMVDELVSGQKNAVFSAVTKCTGDVRMLLQEPAAEKQEWLLGKIEGIVSSRLETAMSAWRARKEAEALASVQEYHKQQIARMRRNAEQHARDVSKKSQRAVQAKHASISKLKQKLAQTSSLRESHESMLVRATSAESLVQKEHEKVVDQERFFEMQRKGFEQRIARLEKDLRMETRRKIDAERELKESKATWEYEKERLTTRVEVLQDVKKKTEGSNTDYMMSSIAKAKADQV